MLGHNVLIAYRPNGVFCVRVIVRVLFYIVQ